MQTNPGLLNRRQMLKTAALTAGATLVPATSLLAEDQQHEVETVIRNNRIKQTVCRWCYDKIPLEDLCRNAAKFGFKGIDLVEPADYPTLKKYGLIGTTTKTHTIPKGLNRKENWDECLGKIRTAIDAASEAGFPNVICFSGNRAKMDDEEGMNNCAEALKLVVGQAEKKNVMIVMELLNSKVNHPDYMCDHSAWGVKLVKMVGSEHFKMLYDIYHMQIMEGDVIRTIKTHKDSFAHYHTGGVPGRHEIDDSQELYYPAIVRAIVETGYTGWLGQEFIPARDPIVSLGQSGKICDV